MKSRRVKAILGEFLRGMGSVVDLAPHRAYVRQSGGFRRDARSLAGDVRRVGENLRYALRNDG